METFDIKIKNKYWSICVLLLFNITVLYSQNNCNSAVQLNVSPDNNCANVITVSNSGFTDSGVTPLGCQIPSGNPDWWGKFTATSDYTAVRVSNYSSDFHECGVLVYSGTCAANMNLVECGIVVFNTDLPMEAIAPTNPGEQYYVRVTDASVIANFKLCVYEFDHEEYPDNGSCGDNMDFELGNFSSWTGYTGSCCPIVMTSTGFQNQGINAAIYMDWDIEPSQHTITRGLDRDPLTELNVPIVAPHGGEYSVRLGNAHPNYGAECIEKSFTVTPDNSGITYFYAVMLEDPEHTYEDQPRFHVEVTDAGGGLIDCAQYEVVSGFGTGDWESTPCTNPWQGFCTIMWKDWTPVSFDLTPHIGQNVTIKACTGDCGEGAHMGYAYFDLICYPLEPMGTKFCTTGEPIELCVPDGYIEYNWNTGESTQCITISDPQEGDIYSITVTNVNGCTSVITDTLEIMDGYAWEDAVICPDEIVDLHAEFDAPAEYHWTSDPPGFTSSEQDISVTQSEIGVYYYIVEMIPLDTQFAECAVIDTVIIEVVDCDCVTPPVTFEITPPPCCGDNAIITYTGPGLGTVDATHLVNPTWSWNIGTNSTLVSGNLSGSGVIPDNLVVSYPCNQNFTVTLTVQNHINGGNCEPSDTSFSSFIPEQLTCTITGTNPSCYGVCDATASVTACGGTGTHFFAWGNGAGSNSTATGLCGGTTYTVTITDENGCTATASHTPTDPPLLTLTVTGTNPSCHGVCDATATSTASGGTGILSYQWDNGAGINPDANGLCGGTTYTLVVTDQNGCTVSGSHMPVDPPLLTLSVTGTNPSCFGYCDATATSLASGGTGTLSYQWSNGAGTEANASGLCGGITYTLTVTDQNGCTATASHTPADPPGVALTVTGTNPSCHGVCDATATSTASGGTGILSYQWDNGAGTNPDANGLCGGTTYTLVVTDQNGCTVSGSHMPVDPPLLTLSVTGTNPSCFGYCDATATSLASGGTGTLSYQWSNGAGTEANASGLCGGITYTLTVTDANGCTATASHTPADPPGVILTVTGTNPSCYGYCDATATSTASGGSGTLSYQWDNGAGTNPDASGLCGSTTYTLVVTDQNGCTVSGSHTPVDPPLLVITVTGTHPSCYGVCDATASVTGTGGTGSYTYIWDNGGGTGANASNLCGGTTYSVTVTDQNGCTAVGSHTPVDPPLLTLTVTGNNPTCYGSCDATASSTANGGTGAYIYNWSNGAGTGANASGLCGGITYSLTVTDQNGCMATGSHTPIDPPAIVIDNPIVTDVTCYGYNDGTITVSATGGTGTLSYSIPGITNQNGYFGELDAGQYTITVTDQNGCINTVDATITEPPDLILTITSDTVCIDEMTSVTVYATGGTPGYTYLWNNFETTQTIIDIPGVTTDYSVLVTDTNNCIKNISTTISVYPPLAITVYPNDTICEGETATIYATYSGGMGTPYTLTLNGTTIIQTPYTVTPTVTTVYEVCINDACPTPVACDDLEIVVMPDPPVNFVADFYNGCEPLEVHFNEINQHEGQTYFWDFGDPWGSTTGTGKNPVHTFENPGIYDVTCTVTSVYGCTSTWTWYEMISVWPNPVAAFFPYPQVTTILEPYIYFENNSSTYYITNWTFGDGDSSNVIHPQHKYDSPDTYNVMLAVETEHGCVDTTWSEIIIQDIITFYAPTAFSPDFDDINGLFSPIGHGIDPDNWYLAIYDRWGEKVWETFIYDVDEETGHVNHGWDGTIRDKKIGETGVYGWLVIYKDVTGAEHQKAGLVTLIR